MAARLLSIYLNDHLAGATVGVELARRSARENAGTPLGAFLSDMLLPEIAEDRDTLLSLMNRLGIPPSRPKTAAAWFLEKIGRLKPNGEWRRYSPLSRLLELEGLAAGIEGKHALWVSLERVRDTDARLQELDLAHLARRARSQRERLEEHRQAAAVTALG